MIMCDYKKKPLHKCCCPQDSIVRGLISSHKLCFLMCSVYLLIFLLITNVALGQIRWESLLGVLSYNCCHAKRLFPSWRISKMKTFGWKRIQSVLSCKLFCRFPFQISFLHGCLCPPVFKIDGNAKWNPHLWTQRTQIHLHLSDKQH